MSERMEVGWEEELTVTKSNYEENWMDKWEGKVTYLSPSLWYCYGSLLKSGLACVQYLESNGERRGWR